MAGACPMVRFEPVGCEFSIIVLATVFGWSRADPYPWQAASTIRDFLLLVVQLIVTLAKLARPGDAPRP